MKDPAEVFVGLDIGGTRVKGGAVRSDELEGLHGSTLKGRLESIGTSLDDGPGPFLDSVADFARSLGCDAGWRGRLGVGSPGIFDPRTGAITHSANMPALEGCDLASELSRRLGTQRERVCVGNDGNMAASGERWLGAGREVSDFVLLTLGTGIGGGIILGGELYRGHDGNGGEVGHVVVRRPTPDQPDEDGLRCDCGAHGCLERLASATAARRRARAAGLTDDLEALTALARAGPGPERSVLRSVGRDLGYGMLTVTALLDVAYFVVGGGFGAALDVLRPGIEEALGERDYGGAKAVIVGAELGESAGWIGAAKLAMQ